VAHSRFSGLSALEAFKPGSNFGQTPAGSPTDAVHKIAKQNDKTKRKRRQRISRWMGEAVLLLPLL